jgi:hypothetical protein
MMDYVKSRVSVSLLSFDASSMKIEAETGGKFAGIVIRFSITRKLFPSLEG